MIVNLSAAQERMLFSVRALEVTAVESPSASKGQLPIRSSCQT